MRLAVVTAVLLVCASSYARAGAVAASPMKPAKIRVLVLNGTHRVGLAASVSATLAKQGFRMQQLARPWLANGPAPAAVTTIYFDVGQSRARAAAVVLQDRFEPGTAVRDSTKPIGRLADHAGRPLLVIVLGSSFRGAR